MEKKLFISSIAIVFSLFVCCTQEDETLSNIPTLTLFSVAPKQLTQFKDSLVLTVAYADGDGDLGGVHPDSNNLFVKDSRIDLTYGYRIQELVPGGETVPIQGNLRVLVNGLFLVEDSLQEQASFSIYAVDKAGNKSNVLQTEAVTIVR